MSASGNKRSGDDANPGPPKQPRISKLPPPNRYALADGHTCADIELLLQMWNETTRTAAKIFVGNCPATASTDDLACQLVKVMVTAHEWCVDREVYEAGGHVRDAIKDMGVAGIIVTVYEQAVALDKRLASKTMIEWIKIGSDVDGWMLRPGMRYLADAAWELEEWEVKELIRFADEIGPKHVCPCTVKHDHCVGLRLAMPVEDGARVVFHGHGELEYVDSDKSTTQVAVLRAFLGSPELFAPWDQLCMIPKTGTAVWYLDQLAAAVAARPVPGAVDDAVRELGLIDTVTRYPFSHGHVARIAGLISEQIDNAAAATKMVYDQNHAHTPVGSWNMMMGRMMKMIPEWAVVKRRTKPAVAKALAVAMADAFGFPGVTDHKTLFAKFA